MAIKEKLNVFFAYSHRDRELKSELERHLSQLRRNKTIETWSDNELIAGQVWEEEIQKKLEAADIILLLISSDFLASDYCTNIEMEKALERHRSGTALVIPILLRSCVWQDSPFRHLQFLPRDGFVFNKKRDIDEAFTEVVLGIRDSVNNLIQRKINEADYFSFKERADMLFQEKSFDEARKLYEHAYEIINNPDINNKIKLCEEFLRIENSSSKETTKNEFLNQKKFTTVVESGDIIKQIEKLDFFKTNSLYEQGLLHSRELIKKVMPDSKEEKLLKKYISYFSSLIN